MLKLQPIPPVPETTARAAHAAFPKGHRYLTLRDNLGTIFSDEMFAGLFPTNGRPAEAPWRLALVTVVQHAEGLSDREAADAVRDRVTLRYLLGLDYDDPGFDYSILSRFRDRLIEGDAEHMLLDALIEASRKAGLLKDRGKVRTDSTHILSAARGLTRSENVTETMRAALNALAVVAPDWLRSLAPDEWYKRYSERAEHYRLKRLEKDLRVFAEQVGRDGFVLLNAVYFGAAPAYLKELPQLDVLRRCWLEQYWLDEGVLKLRDPDDTRPSPERLHNPYDTDVRYGTKNSASWSGYKVHYSESCDEDAPHLIVHVDTTAAPTADLVRVTPIHEALKTKNLLPSEHFVDNHYVTSKLLVDSEDVFGVKLVGPIKAHAKPKGFGIDMFAIDWDKHVTTCPAGKQSISWIQKGYNGQERVMMRFASDDCRACPLNKRCAKNTERIGYTLSVLPQKQHEARERVKREQETWQWHVHYNIRRGVEATFSQGVGIGLRRSRYHGQKKSHLHHLAVAASINLQRLADWFDEVPRAKTRTSRFAALKA